jgi:glycosyltransferase involved in cell wall biosynthesis
MARGTPVLAAATGGLPEVVTALSGGRLVSSNDQAAWCRSIERVLRSRRLHRQLSRRGPAHVALRHAPDDLARRLVAGVYRPLLAGAVRR